MAAAVDLAIVAECVYLYRAKAAYSHRTFPVGLRVCPYVYCGKTADRIWMLGGGVRGHASPSQLNLCNLDLG